MNRKEWMLYIVIVLVVVRTSLFAYAVMTHSVTAIELQALKMTAVVVVVLATCGFIFLPLLWERKQ
jgi:hypothetical protein